MQELIEYTDFAELLPGSIYNYYHCAITSCQATKMLLQNV